MCVWSAFIGKKQAAPEVWKTGTAIEGFWSGFYTGIATVDENGIHSAKCCGYSKHWQEKFDLKDFPGKAALFHSRTNSGGDDAWGHPFTGTNKRVAIVSQGNDGVFPDMHPWAELGNELVANGKIFAARAFNVPLKRYPLLSDGAKVHTAEIIAQAVEYFYEKNGNAIEAIRSLWSRVHEEGITLFLFSDQPDKIYFINMNQSGVLYFTPEGTYASSSRMAFGLPLVKHTELPINSVGYFTAEGLYSEALPDPGFPILDRIPDGVIGAALDYLKKNPDATMAQITDQGFGPLFPEKGIRLRALTAHRLIETLSSEGWISQKNCETEGPCGTKGLVTKFSLTEKFFKQFS